MPTITPFYAGLLAILFVLLSIRVIRVRRGTKIAIGSGGNAELERAGRVHANFAEYAPFGLLLIYLVEMSRYADWVVHLLGIALLAGRAVHAFGLSRTEEDYRFRVTGMGVTFGVLLAAAILLLANVVLR